MATLNDFKLVNQYAKFLFDKMRLSEDKRGTIDEVAQKRLGFYMLVLQLVTGNTDMFELQDCIIDTDYCRLMRGIKNNDYGVDAVYIDEESKSIKLFNFKYRERFNPRGGKQAPVLDATKFINVLLNEEVLDASGNDTLTYQKIQQIREYLNSDSQWNFELFMVTNENTGVVLESTEMLSVAKSYGMEITNIVLDDIVSFLLNRPERVSCSFIVDRSAVLTYETGDIDSSKSYLVRLSIANLIRITNADSRLREEYGLSDYTELIGTELEYGVLFENVRGALGQKRKFNKNILNTLFQEPERFFMYNNGITITTKNVVATYTNAKTKLLIKLEDVQVVNGGQTLTTVFDFLEKYSETPGFQEKLEEAAVLVRIFKTDGEEKLTNEIAEFTNSQNAVSAADLKSISTLQIKIEQFLKQHGIEYVRKVGYLGMESGVGRQITKEALAQILYSYNGYPDRATNQKSKLFDVYYGEIFDESNLDFEKIHKLIRLYFRIEDIYSSGSYDFFKSKYFYVIFLLRDCDEEVLKMIGSEDNDALVIEAIEKVEGALREYRKGEEVSDARKLIQSAFKEHLTNYAEIS